MAVYVIIDRAPARSSSGAAAGAIIQKYQTAFSTYQRARVCKQQFGVD